MSEGREAAQGLRAPEDAARRGDLTVFAFAFGYLACYVPYSAITKAVTSGEAPLTGLAILPVSATTSMLAMFVTLTSLGWWRYAGHRELLGRSLPWPGRWTFLSGIATSSILLTTTLAYTFEGVSIPFVMLLMRGGVLLLAPVVDLLSGRRVRWFSWVALGLSLLGLVDALARKGAGGVPLACAVDVGVYLAGYFVRLRLMAKLGKSEDRATSLRFFVEEQMVATPAAVLLLAVLAAWGGGPLAELRRGFLEVPTSPQLPWVLLLGALSQGTGVFGALVLLDARESTFAVPLNRASSILAGVFAAFALAALGRGTAPGGLELVGAGLLVLAIGVLSFGQRIDDAVRAGGALRELGTIPNLLTLARLPLAALFVALRDAREASLAILGAAGLTDVLDGWAARRLGQASRLGAGLDGVVDKVFALAVTGTLLFQAKLSPLEALLLGTRDLGEIGLLAWLSASRGLHPERERKALPVGKLTTTLQFGAIVLAILERPERTAAVVCAAIAGVGAAVEYWRRDLEG